jgi:dolichyl-diphosphooligosaccharide--protein glycosyltransferase
MHFTSKMNRLILICAPICAIGCAVWCGFLLDFLLQPFLLLLGKKGYEGPSASGQEKLDSSKKDGEKDKGKSKKGPKANNNASVVAPYEPAEWEEKEERPGGVAEFKRELKASILQAITPETMEMTHQARIYLDRNPMALLARAGFSVCFVAYVYYLSSVVPRAETFLEHCERMARSLNNPRVVYHAQDRVKGAVVIDDYLKGYQWLAKNTAEDARVMAWWDYGYQITGIANRTSIADGNTWNHEHIATLGRTLTSPEKKAHNVIRHLADYVLVFAGGGGDDLAKSPHLARIGNSVFPDHCGDADPKCNKFGFYEDRSPTPMMANSLLYKAVKHNLEPGVRLNQRLFKEVHTTRNGLLRIFEVQNISQESKEWIDDPANRVCDAPGSWYCIGQYPPALHKLIAKRRNFAQVEDFNKAGTKSAYTKLIEKEAGGGGREL